MSPFLLKIEDAAEMLSISRAHIYKLIQSGHLHVVHLGRSVRVPAGELERLISDLTAEGGESRDC